MHRLNGVGLAALDRHTTTTNSYTTLSTTLSHAQITHLHAQLTLFRTALTAFAAKHRTAILNSPSFRHKFTQMCSSIGVDPLAGPRRGGWWAEVIPWVGDWEYELGIQIVDVCVSTRERNGGMIEVADLCRLLNKLRGSPSPSSSSSSSSSPPSSNSSPVTEPDILRSVKTLHPLSSGYTVLTLSDGRKYVRSVPKELDQDQAVILAFARGSGRFGRVSVEDLVGGSSATSSTSTSDDSVSTTLVSTTTSTLPSTTLGWTRARATAALENMLLRDGLCWVDEQDREADRVYWVTSAMRWD
ncbi:EAP30/Vps36 family-domain-containing protein [Lentinula edodes]|uniref:EAP30/Vps36 family-domain-containing protein n=1 Tax=Lentinula lateritia TaxID=40482 RepID=A0A9W9A6E4_9AGAR|nr:EAP30/Vps36 family-domain-containing protein [Lentinula edodes]